MVAASNFTAYYCCTDLRVQCSKVSVVDIASIQESKYQCDVKAFKRSVCAGVCLDNNIMSRFVVDRDEFVLVFYWNMRFASNPWPHNSF